MFAPIISSQGNNMVSANKAIIETHVAVRRCKNYSQRTIKILQSESITQRKQ